MSILLNHRRHTSLSRPPVVVLTGASSGIGRAIALALAHDGARLVLAARRADVLQEVASECTNLGSQAIAVPVDVSQASEVEALAARAVEAFGLIDIWINSAAVLHLGRIDETPADVLDRVISINVMGYLHGTRVAIARFRRQKAGILINIASALGITAQPYASAYVASKFAIRGLSDSIRQEVRDEPNIHVCTVLPFAIDTPIYQHAANYTGRKIGPIHPRYPADVVVKAVKDLIRRPRANAYAGGLAAAVPWPKRVFPQLTGMIVRSAIDLMQIGQEPEQQSDGNLFHSGRDRWKASGGWGHSANAATDAALFALATAAVTAGALVLLRYSRKRRNKR